MTLSANPRTARPIEIQFRRLRADARLPERQTAMASGFDLHACIDESIEVGTMPVRVPCGFAIAAPADADVQIRPRSGLSAKGVMATLGTIDADYRGELMVMLYCLEGAAPFVVANGDRIAQLVVSRLAEVEWTEVDTLDATDRGEGGYGSTGMR